MAASEALHMQGELPPTAAPPPAIETAAVTDTVAAAAPRWPHLTPIAQLIAVVLAVFAIIWNQQQTTDTLRTELKADISEVRAQVSENGQRLARIEGFLGIGMPDEVPVNPE